MKISIDISYYPLTDEFKAPIKGFIAKLKKHNEIIVKSNSISTQVFGEFDEVFRIVSAEIKKAMDLPHSVFVLKIINADLDK